MKKNILWAIMLLGIVTSAQAQHFSKNAIGLRLGNNDGFGAEVSYQVRLSAKNRLELDLGLRNNHDEDKVKLTGLYQWVWNIDGGLNWYAGVGGGVGSWRYEDKHGYHDNGAFAFAAGDIGLEYNFDFPLQVFVDARPEIYFNSHSFEDDDNFGPDIALGARFRF